MFTGRPRRSSAEGESSRVARRRHSRGRFAFFGSSRVVTFGPKSAIAVLLGATLGNIAPDDVQHRVALARTATVLVAAISLIAWALRVGQIASFVSDTVLTGFKAGAAVVIASTQIPALLGIQTSTRELFPLVAELGQRVAEIHSPTLVIGVAALALLALGQWLLPARPVALMVVIASIIASELFDFDGYNVAVVGALPRGLPGLDLPTPDLAEVRLVLPLALGCFLHAFVEDVTAVRTFAAAKREEGMPTPSCSRSAPRTSRPRSCRGSPPRAVCRNRR